ncbi:MAG: hypothetical protein HOC20_07710 [Chloroflexi bacterium]|jgi:hypothetical protein|nr:hypothetical protein [Chloroflexota bacterium]
MSIGNDVKVDDMLVTPVSIPMSICSGKVNDIGVVVVALLIIMLMGFGCSSKYTTATICDSVEFNSPLDSVSLVYAVPKDEDIVVWSCLSLPFGGNHPDDRSAAVNNEAGLEDCVLLQNLPVDIRNRLLAVDFSFQRIVLVSLTHGPKERINYRDHELMGNSATLCFDHDIYHGDQPAIPVLKQFIFAVNLSNLS